MEFLCFVLAIWILLSICCGIESSGKNVWSSERTKKYYAKRGYKVEK